MSQPATAPPSKRILEYIRLGILALDEPLHVKRPRLLSLASMRGLVGGSPLDSAPALLQEETNSMTGDKQLAVILFQGRMLGSACHWIVVHWQHVFSDRFAVQ